MKLVENFISGRTEKQQALFKEIRELILSTDRRIQEMVKWNLPFYARHGLLCYLKPKKESVLLGFCHGAMLEDKYNLLNGSGKNIRYILIRSVEEINKNLLQEMLKEATAINQILVHRRNLYI